MKLLGLIKLVVIIAILILIIILINNGQAGNFINFLKEHALELLK